jgi:hypothetical protein
LSRRSGGSQCTGRLHRRIGIILLDPYCDTEQQTCQAKKKWLNAPNYDSRMQRDQVLIGIKTNIFNQLIESPALLSSHCDSCERSSCRLSAFLSKARVVFSTLTG